VLDADRVGGNDAKRCWQSGNRRSIHAIEGRDNDGLGTARRLLQLLGAKAAVVRIDPNVVALPEQVEHRWRQRSRHRQIESWQSLFCTRHHRLTCKRRLTAGPAKGSTAATRANFRLPHW
jgi:hypothetical protein